MTRVRARKGASIEERLRLHMIEAPSGCWIWVGACSQGTGSRESYGRFQLNGKTLYAHRVSYQTFVGPIPEGLQLDHLCRRPRCIRPEHLQAVTPSLNVRRGTSPGARALRRGACLRGHAHSEHAVKHGVRMYCRACMREHHRRYNALRAAERRAAKATRMADLIAYRDGQESAA